MRSVFTRWSNSHKVIHKTPEPAAGGGINDRNVLPLVWGHDNQSKESHSVPQTISEEIIRPVSIIQFEKATLNLRDQVTRAFEGLKITSI
jgi:hypothetical protein